MSNPVEPTSNIDPKEALSPASQAQATTTSNAATAANATSEGGAAKFNSMEDLRNKEPKLYKTIVMGLGMAMCQKMRRDQERHRKIMREYRNNA